MAARFKGGCSTRLNYPSSVLLHVWLNTPVWLLKPYRSATRVTFALDVSVLENSTTAHTLSPDGGIVVKKLLPAHQA